ncbi:hypothetical protein M9Y10_010369 [Tritrichomonas musculus]|uniref:Protein kinase domain-containing protein n=1 Tax=Tritrichomonas musculus TaxID=1915356 RepID=A0ABR2ILU9_9EUKA
MTDYLAPPNRFDFYRNIKNICATHNSYVYVSHINGTQRGEKIVLKFIPKGGHISNEQIDNECKIQSSIHHPFIMPARYIFDIDYERQPYRVIEMPLAIGSLADTHAEKLLYGIIHASKIMYQIALAVMYLHINHILHGDINPRNVVLMVDNKDNPVAQIIDFGHACELKHQTLVDDNTGHTYDGYFCTCNRLTPRYSSPEVLGRKPHSFPSDIWSLGATFYFIITGKCVYHENNYDFMIKEAKYPYLNYNTKLGPEFPQIGKDLITKMLSFEESNRPTAQECLDSPFFNSILDPKWMEEQNNLISQMDKSSEINDALNL